MAKKKDTNKQLPLIGEEIIEMPMEDVMHNSMMPYAEHVILERALPRVEDGLKPVQRRVLYTMLELSTTHDKPHRKCARIVGDCLGKYHPHGDLSVYDAMARMAQPFVMRGLLVDGHGNFGSIDGDSPAAMRYTEARMTRLAEDMLKDLNKDTVDFHFNFDDTLKEPDLLPARVPNLLLNGASGIAVGLATNIPPHNLREVISAVIAQIDQPAISIEKLMRKLPGPDFPTGGCIIQSDELRRAYETGRGKLLVRAKTHFEKGSAGRTLIVIDEIPYQVSKSAMLERILKVSEDRKEQLGCIYDIRDESDRTGMRAVIELKRDTDPERALRLLYKYTSMQVTFGVNMVAISNGKPKCMGLKEINASFINHRITVVTRRTQYELAQAKARLHILDGLIIALDNLDAVIKLIRAAKNPSEARAALMAEFDLSKVQAQAILDMRLQRLTNLEMITLREEHAILLKETQRLEEILGDNKKIMQIIKDELRAAAKDFGDDRRSEIIVISDEDESQDDENIPAAQVLIQITHDQIIKKLPQDDGDTEYITGVQTINTNDRARALFFTDLGNCYSIPCGQIPLGKPKDKGLAAHGLLPDLIGDERVIYLSSTDTLEGELVFVTKMGTVKKSQAKLYNIRKIKFPAISLKENDSVISVLNAEKNAFLSMVTKSGLCLKIDHTKISSIGRVTAGVRGMKLEDEDEIIAALNVYDKGMLVMISDAGYAKKVFLSDVELRNRDGKGITIIKLKVNKSNGERIVYSGYESAPYDVLLHMADGSVINSNTGDISPDKPGGFGRLLPLGSVGDRIERVLD